MASIYLIVLMLLEHRFSLTDENNYGMKLLGFLLSISILSIVSLIDDVKDIRAWIKLITQIVCASLIYVFGVRISDIGGTVLNPVISYLLTTAWIIGITNAINLIDGLDGLSSGITLISSLSLLIIFATNDSSTLSMILITALARRNCRILTI